MNTAWIAVVATLGGVVLGGGASWLLELSRWRRQEATRWHDDRRRLYADFLRECDAVATAEVRRDPPPRVRNVREAPQPTLPEALELVYKTGDRVAPLRWEIELLGGERVRDTADAAYRALAVLLAATGVQGEQDNRELERNFRAAIDGFRDAARAELGLTK